MLTLDVYRNAILPSCLEKNKGLYCPTLYRPKDMLTYDDKKVLTMSCKQTKVPLESYKSGEEVFLEGKD